MPKFTREFSEALGFKLLGYFHSFLQEYPKEGSQIQKIYDEGFKDTLYKCFPIIAELGVDPITYQKTLSSTSALSLKEELRKVFPIKKVEEKKVEKRKSEEIEEEYEEEEEEEELRETSPRNSPRPVRISPKRCTNCDQLNKEISELKEEKKQFQAAIKEATEENLGLRKELGASNERLNAMVSMKNGEIRSKNSMINNMKEELRAKTFEISKLKEELCSIKKELCKSKEELVLTKKELSYFKNDSELVTILGYLKTKRQ